MCSLCRTCEVISLFPRRNSPVALGSWAFQSHPCCQVWLFPLDVHLLADWKSYSHRNRKIAAVLSALPFWRGCLSHSSREILAPTGTWDIFFVIPPSFVSTIFLFFVKTETWRCLIPLATFLSTVGREVWGYLRTDQKWYKKKSLPWNWVRPTLGLPKKKSFTLDSKLDQPWSSSKINLYPWPWVKLTLQLPTKKSFSNSQKEAPDSSSCWGALLLNIPKV